MPARIVVNYSSADSVVFCRVCGSYCSRKVNAALRSHCSGLPSAGGKAALARINRGLHPSRVGKFKHCLALGRPEAFRAEEVMAASEQPPGRNQGIASGILERLQSLLDRVRGRMSGVSSGSTGTG